MAGKKPTTKAHRGFIHIRKRGAGTRPRSPRGPMVTKIDPITGKLSGGERPLTRRPQTPRLPRGPRRPNFSNQQLQQMSDAQLRRYFNAQRKRSIAQQLSSQSRKRFLDRIKRANLSPAQRGVEISRYNAYLSNLRKGLDASGKPIPKGIDIVKQFRKSIEQDKKRLQQMKQQQRMPTQKQIEEAKKRLQQAIEKTRQQQTAAPAQQAVINPNIRRRPMTAEQRQRMIRSQNVRVAKGGAVRKKK